MAFVASVFSLKMRCSFSPQRSTSDIIKSVRKSCRNTKIKRVEHKVKNCKSYNPVWLECCFWISLILTIINQFVTTINLPEPDCDSLDLFQCSLVLKNSS